MSADPSESDDNTSIVGTFWVDGRGARSVANKSRSLNS